jgi:hypothetical protein
MDEQIDEQLKDPITTTRRISVSPSLDILKGIELVYYWCYDKLPHTL